MIEPSSVEAVMNCAVMHGPALTYEDDPLQLAFYDDLAVVGNRLIETGTGVRFALWPTHVAGQPHRMLPLEKVQDGGEMVVLEAYHGFLYDPAQLYRRASEHWTTERATAAGVYVWEIGREFNVSKAKSMLEGLYERVGENVSRLIRLQTVMQLIADGWGEDHVHVFAVVDEKQGGEVGYQFVWTEPALQKAYTSHRMLTPECRGYSRALLAYVADWLWKRGYTEISDGSCGDSQGLWQFKQSLVPKGYEMYGAVNIPGGVLYEYP